MRNHVDPEGAALYALIAVALVAAGAVLATTALTPQERGAVLAGSVAVLLLVAYRWRHRTQADD